MTSKTKYYEIIFFLCVFIVSLVLNLTVQKYQFPNTDTNQNNLFAGLLKEQGTFRYNNELNQKYNPQIFGIRGLLNFGNGFVPSSLPGIIIILAIFKSVSNELVVLINPIFVFIGLYYFYKITDKYIFKNKFYSLTTTLVYFFSGAFLYVSSVPFKDLTSTSLFFVGLYYILNAIYDKKWWNFLIFGLFAGASTWLNYPSIIFFFPVAVLYLINIKKAFFTRGNFKNLAICLTSFLALFIPLYIYQVELFNGFLNFNNSQFQLNQFEAFTSKSGVLNFILVLDFHKLLVNFYNQVFLISPPLILLCIMAITYIFLNYIKEKRTSNILITLLTIILMQFLFYLGKSWSGESFIGSVGTSYARYLLVSWGLLTVFAIYAIRLLIHNKSVLTLLAFIFIFSGLNKGLYSDMAIMYFINTSSWANNLKEQIRRKTPENSIFFTSFYDKYIYPVRQTAIYVAIPKEQRLNKTVSLIKALLADSIPVYIVDEKDEWAISLENDRLYFIENGLDIKYAFGNIYKIEKGNGL